MRSDVRRSAGSVTVVALSAVLAELISTPMAVDAATLGSYSARPSVELRGTFRNFTPSDEPGGQVDFGKAAASGGRYAHIVADQLDDNGKPVFHSTGQKILQPWTDADARQIIDTRNYVKAMTGDTAGTLDSATGGAVTDAATFGQWYRDVAGVNSTDTGTLVMTRDGTSGNYIFDGYLDAGGTLPGAAGDPTDSSYTYEIDTTFVYEAGTGQFIETTTDGDVWVYVDRRVAIDGGAGDNAFMAAAGIAVSGSINLANSATIDVADGDVASISTNGSSDGIITLDNQFNVDGNILIGPGGNPGTAVDESGNGTRTGILGVLDEPVPLPGPVTAPVIGPSVGNTTMSNGNYTISGDLHTDNLRIDTGAHVRIQGDVTILCDGDFTLRNSSEIQLAPNSTLNVYVAGSFFIGQTVEVNTSTQDPRLVTFYNLGNSTFDLNNGVEIYANFVGPSSTLHVGNSVHLYGSFMGESLDMDNTGHFTVDTDDSAPKTVEVLDQAPVMTERIDLDRLIWLTDGRTYTLKVFFADRQRPKSRLRLETSIQSLDLAYPPTLVQVD